MCFYINKLKLLKNTKKYQFDFFKTNILLKNIKNKSYGVPKQISSIRQNVIFCCYFKTEKTRIIKIGIKQF